MINMVEESTIERHISSEEKMSERICLPYTKALEVFHSCIEINNNLFIAFNNYKIHKYEQFSNLNHKEDILIHVAVDKFAAKLFFTTMNEKTLSLIEFDCNSDSFTELHKNVTAKRAFKRPSENNETFYQSDRHNDFEFSILNVESILKEVWDSSNFSYLYTINILDPSQRVNPRNVRYRFDTPFINEGEYNRWRRTFSPLRKDFEETNRINLTYKYFESYYNPGHTTLFSDDIESFLKNLSTKNARSII